MQGRVVVELHPVDVEASGVLVGARELADGDVDPLVRAAAEGIHIGARLDRLFDQRFVAVPRGLPQSEVHGLDLFWRRGRNFLYR